MILGTHLRIFATEWKTLAKLIVEHSISAKEKPITMIEELENFDIENLENITFSTTEEIPHILSEKQILTIFQGPFGAMFKDKIAAYAQISRFRLEIHFSKDEMFKDKRASIPEADKIPSKLIEKFNFEKLDDIQEQLDQLSETHNQECKDFITEWTEKLLNFLEKAHLALTEREIKELQNEDIITELLPRFIEVGLKVPIPTPSQINFSDYLFLKAVLTAQSALSRQHLPHDDREIQQKLQGFKTNLIQMRKQEQQLLQKQKHETEQLLKPLEFGSHS